MAIRIRASYSSFEQCSGNRTGQSGSPVAFRPFTEALMGALRTGLPDMPSVEPFRPALGRIVPEWAGAGGRAGESADSLVAVAEGVLRLLRGLACGERRAFRSVR